MENKHKLSEEFIYIGTDTIDKLGFIDKMKETISEEYCGYLTNALKETELHYYQKGKLHFVVDKRSTLKNIDVYEFIITETDLTHDTFIVLLNTELDNTKIKLGNGAILYLKDVTLDNSNIDFDKNVNVGNSYFIATSYIKTNLLLPNVKYLEIRECHIECDKFNITDNKPKLYFENVDIFRPGEEFTYGSNQSNFSKIKNIKIQ